MAPSDTDVLRHTARLIEQTRTTVPGYAAGFCAVGTHDISAVLAATGTRLVELRFGSAAKGIAMPFPGGHLIALDTACTRSDLAFTVRHELAHILAGDASEPTYLTAEDTASHAERVADLYAIADLTPARWIEWVRRGPGGGARSWRAFTLEVVQTYRELTAGWSEARLWDRARLRVALYRQHHL